MLRSPSFLVPWALAALTATLTAGCATRSADVAAAPANPAEFAAWDCPRIDDERDLVQQRAADVAWAVDERVGNNILALGLGVTVFWPALVALRPDGLEAADLARLKGRYEALGVAARGKACPPPGTDLPALRAAALPLKAGERLVYEDRPRAKGPAVEWTLVVSALRRGETEFRRLTPVTPAPPDAPGRAAAPAEPWVQDRAGNLMQVPFGDLLWPRLLRHELALGAVTAGDLLVAGDPQARARLRGQVVAVGPQTVAGRRFDVAVIELFGDAQRGDASTRVEGVIVIDRASGLLLRLDLSSAQAPFSLQRRLVRIEAPG